MKTQSGFVEGMEMELIKQPTFETCGQACISMITGKDIAEVIKDMKTDGYKYRAIN